MNVLDEMMETRYMTLQPTDADMDYCDACDQLRELNWSDKLGGSVCRSCDKVAGRQVFKVEPWARDNHDLPNWEHIAPPARKFLVAFDVDDTLFDHTVKAPAPDVVALLTAFAGMKNAHVLVWSYGGKDYAAKMAKMIGLEHLVNEYAGKAQYKGRLPDLFIDDNGIGVPGGKAWLYVGVEEQI